MLIGLLSPLSSICPLGCGVSTPVSVKFCGAAGDGKQDDTAALRCAIAAASKIHFNVPVHGQHTEASVADVLFPAGAYLVTSPIDLGPRPPRLRGEGGAIIHATDMALDVIMGHNVTNFRVSDLAFVGGRSQLHITNNNNDRATITIERVTFHNCSGAAIRTSGPSVITRGAFSTKLTVRDCIFYVVNQALVNWCDWTTVEGGWVTTSPDMHNKAVFENWNRLFIRDVLGVPGAAYTKEANARWIDNSAYRMSGGWVHVKDVRFGDELGCAMAAVVNFAPHLCIPTKGTIDADLLCKRPPHLHSGHHENNVTLASGYSSVIIEGGYLCSANAANHTDIWLEEIPNVLVISNTQSMTHDAGKDRKLIGVSPTIDLDGPYLADDQPLRKLKIDITDDWDGGGDYGELPEQLLPYVVPERRVRASSPPKKGRWRKGQRVWRKEEAAGDDALVLGWVYTGSGVWANISV